MWQPSLHPAQKTARLLHNRSPLHQLDPPLQHMHVRRGGMLGIECLSGLQTWVHACWCSPAPVDIQGSCDQKRATPQPTCRRQGARRRSPPATCHFTNMLRYKPWPEAISFRRIFSRIAFLTSTSFSHSRRSTFCRKFCFSVYLCQE